MEESAPADIAQRSIARIIDTVILVFAWMIITVVIYQPDSRARQLFTALICCVFWLAYETAGVAQTGSTVGKRVMSIQVVRDDDGALPGWIRSVVRVLPGVVVFLVSQQFFILALPALYSIAGFVEDRRGLVDRVARTRVVKVPPT